MSLTHLISNYGSYNTWANQALADWLLLQNAAKLDEHIPSSFSSINHTVQHMLRTQRFWTAFINEEDISTFKWTLSDEDVSAILQQLSQSSIVMQQAFSAYGETALMKKLKLDMPWAKNERPRYDYILHVINHSTFHRGQIVTMARLLGISDGIPATDYNIFNCLS